MKKIKIVFWLLFAAVTVFIFKNSAKPAAESSQQSGIFVSLAVRYLGFLFKNADSAVVAVRKSAHFFEFFLQGAFLSAALFSVKYHKALIYVLFTGLFTACTDELIQLFFEGRGSMVSDIFVDFAGTCFACICFVFAWLAAEKRRKRG